VHNKRADENHKREFDTLGAYSGDFHMLNSKILDELNQKISELLASSPAKDIEKNMRAMLGTAFTKLDLVTREEFDVQTEVLKRTREKLTELEAKIGALEKNK
jgi:ubiquinone biosynthesis accessory factor UbiK